MALLSSGAIFFTHLLNTFVKVIKIILTFAAY